MGKDDFKSDKPKPHKKGYAKTRDLKMYYEIYGKGKPLVLLHGSFRTISLNWSNFIPELAKKYQVIATEMQGHGRTQDISRDLSFENMADDVSDLLNYLKIDSADILGFSMDGGIAFQMAIRHPEQVRRLVVLSGAYSSNGWLPEVQEALSNFTPKQLEGSEVHKQYLALGNDPNHFSGFIEKVLNIDLQPYDWSDEVKNIKAPLFMVVGDADGIKHEHVWELFKAKGGGKTGEIHGHPNSQLAILPGTSHSEIIQRTGWLIPMITDFLNSDLSNESSAPKE